MPEYEVTAGTVEQDGERHTDGDAITLDESTADWLGEDTSVSLRRVPPAEDDPVVAEPPEGSAPESDPDPGVPDQLRDLPGIGVERAAALASNGYESIASVADADADALADAVGGIGAENAPEVVAAAQERVGGE